MVSDDRDLRADARQKHSSFPLWKVLRFGVIGMAGFLLVMAILQVPVSWWLTTEQQAQRLFDADDYAAAAELYEDPLRQGYALFRDAQFEAAAAAFGRMDTEQSNFNRGNALVMIGKYEEAIKSYDRALQFYPEWKRAIENRAVAIARRDRMKPPEDDAGGTGGELGADEIVFDDRAKNSSQTEDVEVGKGEELDDQSLRELWLRRVKTDPADFLKIKFAYQYSKQAGNEDEKEKR